MLRFVGEISGVQVLDRAFNRVDRYISDFRNVWPAVAAVFYAVEEQQFQSEGARGASGKWAPLSKAYARFKARVFPGQPILRAENTLYDSMTDPEALDAVYRPEPTQLTIGTKDPKARRHHYGDRARNLPARPIISLTESDKRRMQKAIQAELVRFTRSVGFQVEERAA